ncbi:hypothetical protein [Streptomyces sp. NPDC094149]|uniref:hypothetical protein n=1 Tax=Streptomyces sp. NPDC094149 TaxID=3155079 RepID=UPI0033223868
MTRTRYVCAGCDRTVTAAKSRPCVRGCGARLCRTPRRPACNDVHGGMCPALDLPDEEAA